MPNGEFLRHYVEEVRLGEQPSRPRSIERLIEASVAISALYANVKERRGLHIPVGDGLVASFDVGEDAIISPPSRRLLDTLHVSLEDRDAMFPIGSLAHGVTYPDDKSTFAGAIYFLKDGARPHQLTSIFDDSFNSTGPDCNDIHAQAALLTVQRAYQQS